MPALHLIYDRADKLKIELTPEQQRATGMQYAFLRIDAFEDSEVEALTKKLMELLTTEMTA